VAETDWEVDILRILSEVLQFSSFHCFWSEFLRFYGNPDIPIPSAPEVAISKLLMGTGAVPRHPRFSRFHCIFKIRILSAVRRLQIQILYVYGLKSVRESSRSHVGYFSVVKTRENRFCERSARALSSRHKQ
jgi:hypothetical protein